LANATKALLPAFRAIARLAVLADYSDDDVLAAIERVKHPEEGERAPLRTAEFAQLTNQPDYHVGALPKPGDIFFARRFGPREGLPKGIGQIVLAPRLREVSVQIGFTRLEAPTANLQGEFDLGVENCRLGL